jgi:hypothetical protein
MKAFCILAVGAALAASAQARADGASKSSVLGEIDTVVTFCSQINAGEKSHYKELERSVTGVKSDRDLDAMEKTDDYKRASATMKDVLEGAPQEWAAQACLQAIGEADKGGHKDGDKERKK